MFKLIKINGSKNNVPELVKVPIDTTVKYTKGCLYYMWEGKLICPDLITRVLPFIPVETVEAGSGRTDILGYFVTHNMVFEAPIEGDLELPFVGAERDLLRAVSDDAIGVSTESGNALRIINIDEMETRGVVLTTVICSN